MPRCKDWLDALGRQGVFRGLGDTRAPLYATVWVNAANILLCPALIFWAGLGVRGAAIATVASEVRANPQ